MAPDSPPLPTQHALRVGQNFLTILITAALVSLCVTREIPFRVKQFQDRLREGRQCDETLASGLRTSLDGPKSINNLGTIVATMSIPQAVSSGFLSKTSTLIFTLTSRWETSGQAKEVVATSWNLTPQDEVVEPLSLVAVVCNEKMFYGLWADTNNDTVPQPLVGQLSVAMAKMCYGEDAVETQQRLDASDLMFLAFTGTQAAPGYYGANWGAETPEEFEQGLALLGDKLPLVRVARADCRGVDYVVVFVQYA
ncbi:uncharacterized protein PG986_012409 [Apiospora aurea]|uniref:Endo-chitosanase n=1 Tax=Apiospora aurea TaxID=335848 RepID=A0ABR1Q126_9PEZI